MDIDVPRYTVIPSVVLRIFYGEKTVAWVLVDDFAFRQCTCFETATILAEVVDRLYATTTKGDFLAVKVVGNSLGVRV